MGFKSLSLRMFIQACVALFLAVGMIFPTGMVVLADDTVPPTTQEEVTTTDPVTPPEDGTTTDPVTPPNPTDVDPSPESPPAEASPVPVVDGGEVAVTEVPLVESPTEVALPVLPEIPLTTQAESASTGDETVQPTESVQEVVNEVVQTLAENDLALVDENGMPIPLASAEAVELIENADPYFTVGTTTYGWTNAASGLCDSHVSTGHCTISTNPITDAIESSLYTGQQLSIENGTYTSNNVTISKTVNLRPMTNLTVSSITLNNGAVINWSTNGGTQYTLTSLNVFINPGVTLTDGLEVAATGGTITLSAGLYNTETGITVNKSVEIKGAGSGTTEIRAPSSTCTTNCPNLLVISANNIKIRDLKLGGRFSGTAPDANYGIYDNGSSNGLEVYNTIIENFYSAGIYIGQTNPTYRNNTYNIHDNTIQNIRGGTSGTDGIGISILNDTGAGNRTITNNTITNTDIGINFQSSQLDITGNTLYSNSYGIYGQDSSANILRNNIYNNTTGINFSDLDAGNDVNITNNRFNGNTSYGLNYTYSNGTSDPNVDAENNWWGCNTGARTSSTANGCDRSSGNKIDSDPWLMFGLSAIPTSINTNGTSTLSRYMYSSTNLAKTPITGMGWFDNNLPTINKTGTSYGNLAGNTFTAGTVAGLQGFSSTFDSVTANASVEITSPDIVGCMDDTFLEFNPLANVSDPSMCVTPVRVGCMDDSFLEFDPLANTSNSEMCVTPVVAGCMDETYKEFDPLANTSVPAMCVTKIVKGCMDETYKEYDPLANTSDPEMCVTPVIRGCMDENFLEFNPEANTSDSEMCVTPVILGCTDPAAVNFNPAANKSGVCTYKGPVGHYHPPVFGGVGGLADNGLIPVTGGLKGLSCDLANTLALPNGDKVAFSDPLCDFKAGLTQESSGTMPSSLPAGLTFLDGFNLQVEKNSTPFAVLPEPVTHTLTFIVPDSLKGKNLKVLFWDVTLNGGTGGWIEVPFKLMEDGTAVSKPLNYTGLFVLAVAE